MKTNRGESKDYAQLYIQASGGTGTVYNYTATFVGSAYEVEDRSHRPRLRSEGWTPAPEYQSTEASRKARLASVEKMRAEVESRAKESASCYGWPIVPALTVKHEPSYDPGKRNFKALTEAAKRKPVGYVTTKEEAKLVVIRRQPAQGARAYDLSDYKYVVIGDKVYSARREMKDWSLDINKASRFDKYHGDLEITDPAEVGRLVEECRKALNL